MRSPRLGDWEFTAGPGTQTAINNTLYLTAYSSVLHILSSASRAEVKQLLSAHSLFIHQANHSRKMLHWPRNVTCVTTKEKQKCIIDYEENVQDLVNSHI